MAVRRRDLRAVGVVVDAVQGVQEAPDAGPEEGDDRAAQRPQKGGLVGMVAAALPDHCEGEEHHGEEGHDLEAGEDRADPLPVGRRADPVVVMPGAQQAAEERGRDDDVEPLLDDLAVDAGQLQHQVGEDRGHDQLPDALDPDVHHVPPVHLVQAEVVRVVEREQEEDRQAPESEQQDVGDRRLAPLEKGHGDVEEKDQGGNDDAELDPERLLQELAAFVNPEEVADHGAQRADQQDRQLHVGQHRRMDLALGFLRYEKVGGAEEAQDQPDDQRVGVDHPQDVEGQSF